MKKLLILILTLIPLVCQAHYVGPVSTDPKITSFFNNLHSPDGTYCCDESDGLPYYGNYTIQKDGSILLPDGYVFPKGKVVLGNPTGHAIMWQSMGVRFCFSPGPLI